MKFTIEQFRNYLESQDSRDDIMYNLSEENVLKAQPDDVTIHTCEEYDYIEGLLETDIVFKNVLLQDIQRYIFVRIPTNKEYNDLIDKGYFSYDPEELTILKKI